MIHLKTLSSKTASIAVVSSFFLLACSYAAETTTTTTTVTKPAPKPVVSTLEDYKSYTPENRFTFGFSSGFGLVDTSGGLLLSGNIGTKLVPDGFVPEIVNPVFLELHFGPLFTSGVTVWTYSTHLRWDFVKDQTWTLFAIGGLGGSWMSNKLGDRFALHPRFGVGFFYALGNFDLRCDFSHEAITAGVSFPF